ncbi:MAG: hypothetical protein IJI04_02480 [Lachnospiraceae bacterium]|nr:hypothetical protein [Lachnospiraceae bacterium]
MRDRISKSVIRNICCTAHIMLCMVITALLLAGNAAFVHAGEAEIMCVMERIGDGKLGMRIDAGKNSGIDAYDLDLVYDPQSVRPVEAEARGGEPIAFAYHDINDRGVFRIVGLMRDPITKSGTFLYIEWEAVSAEDMQYVPALGVRDLADSEGEDLSYGISYTGVDGGAVTPSPSKQAVSNAENSGNAQGGADRTDEATPSVNADNGNQSGERGNINVAETPASDDAEDTNAYTADGDAAGQAGKNRANLKATAVPDDSRAATDESGDQGEDGTGDMSSEESLADEKGAGRIETENAFSEDAHISDDSVSAHAAVTLDDDTVEQDKDTKPTSVKGAAVIIVLVLAAVLGGVFYYNKKKVR